MHGSRNPLWSLVIAISISPYQAFLAHVKVRPGSPAPSTIRMSAGTDYIAQLPGAPFADGAVWDPLNFCEGASPADIKKWREAEIKHGRVSMLATVGVLVAEVRKHFGVMHHHQYSRILPLRLLPCWTLVEIIAGLDSCL